MNLRPSATLTNDEINRGLNQVIRDGLASETMTALTSGAFLVAIALLLGANNLEIGIIAALPSFTNMFQLVAIWLVRRSGNRRAVSVYCSLAARIPLVIIGLLALLIPAFTSIKVFIALLFIYNFFASVAGTSWNAWMKDLVPENSLGDYFAKRSRIMQIVNVVVSLLLALFLDYYIKQQHPQFLLQTYSGMFIAGGIIGIFGVYVLSKAPEPQAEFSTENIFVLFRKPLKDPNFRKLLIFNCVWIFALNIATPFFTVFLLKTMQLPVSYIIALTITGQLATIFTIRLWGVFADRYSNKSVIGICAPLYILCIIAWCFVGLYSKTYVNIILLFIIYIFSGVATAGINLSLTNIGLKLAPREDAIVYLSVKNIVPAIFSSLAPLLGGKLADFFESRHLDINASWAGPAGSRVFHLISLHGWNFLFLIGAILAFLSLELLLHVKEKGEVDKGTVVRIMRSSIRNSLKENFITGSLMGLHSQLRGIIRKRLL